MGTKKNNKAEEAAFTYNSPVAELRQKLHLLIDKASEIELRQLFSVFSPLEKKENSNAILELAGTLSDEEADEMARNISLMNEQIFPEDWK